MISYREKQLLAVQKMLQDNTDTLIEGVTSMLTHPENASETRFPVMPEVQSYDELVQLAMDKGYDLYIRANDILSKEELEDIKKNRKKYEEEFQAATKLDNKDMAFLFGILVFQIAKQIFIKFDFKEGDERKKANQTDKEFKKEYDHPSEIDESTIAKRYYAPLDQIKNTPNVPYDIVKNTKYFKDGRLTGLGLSPHNHRIKTAGHDPVLGLLFGTGNILTNTATFYEESEKSIGNHINNKFRTIHISYEDRIHYKNAYADKNASTSLMLAKMVQRLRMDQESVKEALKKEVKHIGSDEASIEGIPIPFISYLLGTDAAEELMKEFDYLDLKEAGKTIGTQVMVSEFINQIIGFLYRVYVLWEEVKDAKDWKQKLHIILKEKLAEFDEVKKRKIVLYSNMMASSLNLAVCAGGAAISGCFLKNKEMTKEFLSHLDIGGFLVTITHLCKDEMFIIKVKKDFVYRCAQEDFCKELNEIEIELGQLSRGFNF